MVLFRRAKATGALQQAALQKPSIMSDNNGGLLALVPQAGCVVAGGSSMKVSMEKDNGIAKVTVSGVVDLGASPTLRRQIMGLPDSGVKGLVVDISGVNYMDSSGMATLVEILNHLNAAGGQMIIAGLPEEMREMFRITRLAERFRFMDDAAAALAEIRRTLVHRGGGANTDGA